MENYTIKSSWRYGEREVIEDSTGEEFVLTQKHGLFREDYYTISRAIAIHCCPVDVVPREQFYVYEFAYMIDGCCAVKIVDENTAYQIINNCLKSLMEGNARPAIIYYLKEKVW